MLHKSFKKKTQLLHDLFINILMISFFIVDILKLYLTILSVRTVITVMNFHWEG